MTNIRIIKNGINVSKIIKQLHEHPADWGSQRNIVGVKSLLDRGFPQVDAGVLQLVMGGVESYEDFVGDTELCIPTPAIHHHTEVINFVKRNFKKFSRCGFLSLPVGGEVGQHIDIGLYYKSRDRYHLAIQGSYDYTVGGNTIRVNPGDLLWFNNKLSHGAKNVGDCVRVTFVFDVPHSKNNP